MIGNMNSLMNQMGTGGIANVSGFSLANCSELLGSQMANIGSMGTADVASLTSSFMGGINGNQDANAYMDYLNSDFSKMMMPGTDATNGGGIDITKATSAEGITDIRTSYLKQWFPGMSDEMIAKLNAFYDKMMGDSASIMGSMGVPSSGGSSGGSSGSGSVGGTASAGATVVTSAGELTGTQWGADLANDAAANANGPGGWCFKWVRQALERHGVSGVGGASAYMAADQLAQNDKFKEVSGLSNGDLKNLPAGAVVVWNKGNGHEHGHISIALGDGREASDKIRNQTTNYGTSFRVFMPAQ